MYCLRDWGRFIVSIGSLCPGRFGTRVKIFLFLRLPTKSIGTSARKLGQQHKKSRGVASAWYRLWWYYRYCVVALVLFLNSVQRSDKRFCLQNRFTLIYVPCWCVECYKWLYCTLPKEDSPLRATLIFIKEKSELLRFYLNTQAARWLLLYAIHIYANDCLSEFLRNDALSKDE